VELTEARICFEGRRAKRTRTRVPQRILRADMVLLAKLWGSFVISNFLPNAHPSDLPMTECHLVRCLMDRNITVDAAQMISTEIWVNVKMGGVTQRLGFPSLITTICERKGIKVTRTKRIRDPINKKYIDRYCQDKPDAPPPPPPPEEEPPHTIEELWGRMSQQFQTMNLRLERNEVNNPHYHQQNAAIHRGLNSFYQAQYEMANATMTRQSFFQPLDVFATHVAWPGDMPSYPEGARANVGGDEDLQDESGREEGGAEEEDYLREMEEAEEDNPLGGA
jgi:hypothetical protein